MKSLNEMARRVHEANKHWWTDINTGQPIVRNKGELLALAISEVSEALEGERKNLMDDHLPHRRMAEVEMADTVIRLLDFAAGFDVRLMEGFEHICLPPNKGEALFRITQLICKSFEGAYLSATGISLVIANIQAYCKCHGYDLEGAIEEKLAYNATRPDHTHAARKADGGKKF